MFIAYIENWHAYDKDDLNLYVLFDFTDTLLLRLSASTREDAEEEVRQKILDPALADLDDDLKTIIFEVANEWKVDQKRKEPK